MDLTPEQFDNLTDADKFRMGIVGMSLEETNLKLSIDNAEIESADKIKKTIPVRDAKGHFIKKDK